VTDTTFQAIRMSRTGGPEVLEPVRLPVPPLAPGSLRVRARAIGVGKPDVLIRQGVYRWMPPLPAIPGNELAGEVIEVGEGAGDGWRTGDRVLVSSRELAQRGGCYAAQVCVPAGAVFRLPEGVGWHDAVSLPNYQLAGALLHESGIRRPRSILVHGAAGGVAIALMQMAAVDGIEAIGVASETHKAQYARRWHALPVIDRSLTPDVTHEVRALTDGRGVDLVLDHVAGPGFVHNLGMLAPLGTVLSYNILGGLPPDDLLAALRRHGSLSLGIRCYSIHTLDADPALRRALMQRAIELLAGQRIAPPEPKVLPLSEASLAHELLDQSRLLGKLVLEPDAV
jgi:NADPH2:quinone reductase